jgi:hypothetical protein
MATGPTIVSTSRLRAGTLLCLLNAGCALTTGIDDHRQHMDDERRCAPIDGDLALRRVSLTDIDAADDRVARMAENRVPTAFPGAPY